MPTQIGNKTYPDDTTGVGAGPSRADTNNIMRALQSHASSLGKSPNDLSLPELNDFIAQFYAKRPAPNAMYKLPGNY